MVFIGGRPKQISIPNSGIYPIVTYIPRYDSKLREEAEVKYSNGKYHIYITRKGKRFCNQYIGSFDNMGLVREILLEQFDLDFNRDPMGRSHVWEHTKAGRNIIGDISMHEGSVLISAERNITIGRPKKLKGIHTIAGPTSEVILKTNAAKIRAWREAQTKAYLQKGIKLKGKSSESRLKELIKKAGKYKR
jgi:hypothetical protein